MNRIRTVILGAAGRDFHNLNVVFRDAPAYDVVAFTAQQIPHIADRTYPSELAGQNYRSRIPIHPEDDLEKLIRNREVDLFTVIEMGRLALHPEPEPAAASGALMPTAVATVRVPDE